MVQQRIETSSVDYIHDEVILTSQNHTQGSPAVVLSIPNTQVDTVNNWVSTPTPHGLSADTAVYVYSSDTLPSGLTAYNTYFVVNPTATTFQLSGTFAGPPVILSTQGIGTHTITTGLAIQDRDPWDKVLSALNNFHLDSNTVDALNNSNSPSSVNPYVTQSYFDYLTDGNKVFALVGPAGSGADFEGNDQTPFVAAQAFLSTRDPGGGWIIVLPGLYTFTSSFTLNSGINFEGVHPEAVILDNSGDFSALIVSGNNCFVRKLTIKGTNSVFTPAVTVSGQKCRLEICNIMDFSFAGMALGGHKNKLSYSKIENSVATGSQGLIIQGTSNEVDHCIFSGTLPDGAVKIEGSNCGVFGCTFAASLTGYAYNLISTSVNNNRLVANHYASAAALALSADYGSGTVRYGNTPNTPAANENNFLVPLKEYTGQPTVASSTAVLSNQFTHFPVFSTNLSDLLDHSSSGIPSLDLLIQRNFEERNYFLHSDDPVYDSFGVPTSGVFSWDGSNLGYPTFYIRSVLDRNARWVVNSGTSALAVGEVFYVEIDQTLSGIDIVLSVNIAAAPLALVTPNDAYRMVLAYRRSNGQLVWLHGFRVLNDLDSFDVDGTPLPKVRFVGASESKNPVPPFSGFSGASQSDLTTKFSAQSAHLKLLFEKTNLGFEPLTDDAEFNSDPIEDGWLSDVILNSGIASTPTHILQVKGSTYGLISSDLYIYKRDVNSWDIVPGNPGTPPYVSMSKLFTGIALLQDNGTIVFYDPDNIDSLWTTYSPTLSSKVSSLVPFVTARPANFQTGGQADFHLQTQNFTYFTTLEGHTLKFSFENNTLEYIPRVFTEYPNVGLLSSSLKDTGYNSLRDVDTDFETLDNKLSFTTSLPSGVLGKILPLRDEFYDDFQAINFETLEIENFSHDPSSGSFLAVYKTGTTWYIFGGGKDKAYLYEKITTADINSSYDLVPQFWAVNYLKQEVFVLGPALSDGSFSALRGYFDGSSWIWSVSVLDAPNTCQGVTAIYDFYSGGLNAGDLYALVSNPLRGNRPSFWKYDAVSGIWTFKTLIDAVVNPEDVLVPAAVANCFDYDFSTDPLKGFGVTSPAGISFLVADGARTNRPTRFFLNRDTLTYTGVRLGEAAGPTVDVVTANATANSAFQLLGGAYLTTFNTTYWFAKNSGTGVTLFTFFATPGLWNSNLISGIYAFSVTNRSGNLVSRSHLSNSLSTITSQDTVYFWSNAGLQHVTLEANYITGIVSATIAQTDGHLPAVGLPCFSNPFVSLYQPEIGSFRGGEPSIQIGTRAQDNTHTVQGVGYGYDPDLGKGIFWHEPGTAVKNLGNGLWAGINRSGYLWIANANVRTRQTEYKPNNPAIRGDVIENNLGTTSDFDFAYNGAGTKIAIVYRDASNSNNMAFILYDIATNSINSPHERASIAPFNPAGTGSLATSPRITYNSVTDTWDITAQDAATGRTVFYRRATATPTWSTVEFVGTANNGWSPSAPHIEGTGEVLVAAATSTSNLFVYLRNPGTGFWSVVTPGAAAITGGGFSSPELIKAGSRYWVFGNNDGSIARVAFSSTYSSGWGVFTNPLASSYNRILDCRVYAYSDSVVVASALGASGLVPANRELGIFKFFNNDSVTADIFSAKGRLQSAFYSGEEEDDYGGVSFTVDGKLLYKALRLGRSAHHWSIRVSRNEWDHLGDSALGSGRFITIGDRHFRERFAEHSGQDLVYEFDVNGNEWSSSNLLPIAERETGTYLSLRWPYNADGAPTSLFQTGVNPETYFQAGTLGAVTSREFPVLCGSTRISGGSGASVHYHGSLAILFEPPSTTSMAYFGVAVVGSDNKFKINQINNLRITGTWRVSSPSASLRSYTITGPVDFNLSGSAVGSHLVLEFPTGSSLGLDLIANPLSYWSALDHPQDRYAVVLGEVRDKYFYLYSAVRGGSYLVKLVHGSLEPRELNEVIYQLTYCAPASQNCIVKANGQKFLVEPVDIDSVTIKFAGSLHGSQRLDFPVLSGARQVLLVQGLPPSGQGFYLVRMEEEYGPSQRVNAGVDTVVSRYGDLVVFNSY